MSFLKNWQEEKSSAYLYQLISENETNPTRKKMFDELRKMAEKQAQIWEEKFRNQSFPDQKKLKFKPSIRVRFVGVLLKQTGAHSIRFILSAMKVRGMSTFANHVHSVNAEGNFEHRHKNITSAGNLRAAVFGVNDGLISNVSLMLGIAGAHANHSVIFISGVAGLLAGACSMAAGEYISVRSQREFFEYQIQLEKEELELYPEEEAAELACIYRARGIDKEEAKKLANVMISDPKRALDTLAKEELGLNPAELGSPWGAAIFSFVAFAIGAFIPVVPFIFDNTFSMIFFSIGLTAITLMGIGATLSLFTNRSAILGGLRMLFIGTLAGVSTFLIGKWLGVMLH